MISDESIERIKGVPIKDIVSQFLKLKRSGKDYESNCPFHNEKTPSFKISPAKGMFKCFGCGVSGDGIAFVMKHQNLSYIPAIQWIGKNFGVELEEFDTKVHVKPEPRLEKLGSKALEFFEKDRRISNNTLLRFKITEAVELMPQHSKEVTVICFNYFRDDELVNIKFRGPKKSFKLSKNAELILYNLDAIKDEKTAIIVEGEIDCLTMHECGIYNVASVPNGTPPPNGKFRLEYMDNCWQYFTDKDYVIVATDNDAPGRKLRQELARRIGFEKCKQVIFPEGCKDANEILVKHGPDAVRRVFQNPVSWPIEGLYESEEWEPEVDDLYENGYPPAYKTRIPGFDELLCFYPGQLTTVTGTPQSGKSEFVDFVMTSLSLFENITWAVFSFEQPVTIHITKLAEKFSQKAFDLRSDSRYRMNSKEWQYAKAKIKSHFHFVKLDQLELTMDSLLSKAEELVKQRGVTGLLFDPWNCIEHKNGEMNETTYILACLNKLIHFLKKYNVMGFLVAHPTKLTKNPKTNKYPVPTLYNISGSAHFFNRTDTGFTIVRDLNSNRVDVYVQKVKLHWQGKLGYCSFHYNLMTRQYDFVPESGEPTDISGDQGGWRAVTKDIPFPDQKIVQPKDFSEPSRKSDTEEQF